MRHVLHDVTARNNSLTMLLVCLNRTRVTVLMLKLVYIDIVVFGVLLMITLHLMLLVISLPRIGTSMKTYANEIFVFLLMLVLLFAFGVNVVVFLGRLGHFLNLLTLRRQQHLHIVKFT